MSFPRAGEQCIKLSQAKGAPLIKRGRGTYAERIIDALDFRDRYLAASERGYARWSYVIVHTALSPG
jgi:hypothetical protein